MCTSADSPVLRVAIAATATLAATECSDHTHETDLVGVPICTSVLESALICESDGHLSF